MSVMKYKDPTTGEIKKVGAPKADTYTKTETDTLLQNKAPAGYGYGENIRFASWDDTDGSKFEAYLDNLYDGSSKIIRMNAVSDYPALLVSGNSGYADVNFTDNGDILVNWHGYKSVLSGDDNGTSYLAVKKRTRGEGWSPWEYVNPPMIIGEEYRTTERYLEKPVYVKSFNLTSWTADAVTSLNVAVTVIVDDTMTWRMGTMKNGVDHLSGIKYWVVPNGEIFDSSIGNNMAVKMFGTDNWGGTKILTVKYTKD